MSLKHRYFHFAKHFFKQNQKNCNLNKQQESINNRKVKLSIQTTKKFIFCFLFNLQGTVSLIIWHASKYTLYVKPSTNLLIFTHAKTC